MYIAQRQTIIKNIEIFLIEYTNILPTNVNNTRHTKERLFMYLSAFLFPNCICNIPLRNLPPSNGYIGNKLNNISNILDYIINNLLNTPISIFHVASIIMALVIGPAKATIIFFISNKFPCFIFLL